MPGLRQAGGPGRRAGVPPCRLPCRGTELVPWRGGGPCGCIRVAGRRVSEGALAASYPGMALPSTGSACAQYWPVCAACRGTALLTHNLLTHGFGDCHAGVGCAAAAAGGADRQAGAGRHEVSFHAHCAVVAGPAGVSSVQQAGRGRHVIRRGVGGGGGRSACRPGAAIAAMFLLRRFLLEVPPIRPTGPQALAPASNYRKTAPFHYPFLLEIP